MGLWDRWGRFGTEAALGRMLASLVHRGPDATGDWAGTQGSPLLGHTRLAIQDTSQAGAQPMTSSCGRFVIVLNGEIYNHWELRAQMGDHGAWRSRSDTETLVEAIAAWGVDVALARANGMFAFALWDADSRRLTLARDRLGEKPLYWGMKGGAFLFASELGPILTSGLGPFTVDPDAVQALFHLGYVPDPQSIVSEVRKLEPGCVLVASEEGQGVRVELRRYWDLSSVIAEALRARKPRSEDEWLEEVEAGLKRSIDLRLISDVPLGAFLSGGIDSGLIVSLMSQHASRSVRTFTVGMPTAANEAPRARTLADFLGTDHTEIPVSERDCLDIIPRLPTVFSEPLGDSSQVPTYLVSEITRKHVTVALSGDGGDELFAGYHRHFQARRIWNGLRGMPAPLRRALAWGANTHGGKAVGTAASLAASGFGSNERRMLKIQKGVRLAGSTSLGDLYRRLVSQWPDGGSPMEGATAWAPSLPGWVEGLPGLDPVERLMAYDLVMALPGDMLVKVDRAAMAHSLETRVPFLDHEFLALAFQVPVEFKVRDGQGKHILRQLLRKHTPPGWVDQPQAKQKSGFGIPLNRWLRSDLRDWAEAHLTPERLRETPFLDPKRVQARWDELQRGTGAWQHPFWSILMFQAWVKEYRPYLTFGSEAAATLPRAAVP